MKIPLQTTQPFVPDIKNLQGQSSDNTTTQACQQEWEIQVPLFPLFHIRVTQCNRGL